MATDDPAYDRGAIDALTVPGASLIGRWGLTADPRGAQAVFHLDRRRYLVDVIDVYRRDTPAAYMLRTRQFNGEAGPDVALSAVRLLLRR